MPVESTPTLPAEKISVLMPIYNERQTLAEIIARVLAAPVEIGLELIAIDDHSTDGSWDILQELASGDARIKPWRLERNGGKGTAIRAAIGRMSGTIAILQDADLEYDPVDYPRLIEPLLCNAADAVYGTRFHAGMQGSRFTVHKLGNQLLTGLCNLLNGLHLTDMETCYKAVRTETLKRLRLSARTYTIEPELTTRLAQAGARIVEVPISYTARTVADGKKIRTRDGLLALCQIIKTRFFDRQYLNLE